MKTTVGQFIGGAFALIALFLVLSHFTGFVSDVGSVTAGGSKLFATLQGR